MGKAMGFIIQCRGVTVGRARMKEGKRNPRNLSQKHSLKESLGRNNRLLEGEGGEGTVRSRQRHHNTATAGMYGEHVHSRI